MKPITADKDKNDLPKGTKDPYWDPKTGNVYDRQPDGSYKHIGHYDGNTFKPNAEYDNKPAPGGSNAAPPTPNSEGPSAPPSGAAPQDVGLEAMPAKDQGDLPPETRDPYINPKTGDVYDRDKHGNYKHIGRMEDGEFKPDREPPVKGKSPKDNGLDMLDDKYKDDLPEGTRKPCWDSETGDVYDIQEDGSYKHIGRYEDGKFVKNPEF